MSNKSIAAGTRLPPIEKAVKISRSESKPLIEWAYHKIKELIFQQKLVPNQRLIYKDLCQMLQISRTPIINALSRLEQEGYVKSESFRGFYVQPVDTHEISDHFGIREALEVYAVEYAIRRARPEDMTALENAIQEHRDYMPPFYDKNKFFLDAAVHIKIAGISRNRGLVKMLSKNLEHIYLRLALNTSYQDRMGTAVSEHMSLLKLMKKKEITGSIDLMRKHIQKSREHVLASLNKEETYQSF